MSILETITSILTLALPLLTGLFWNKLKGYRSQIIAIATLAAGVLQKVSEEILPWFSELFGISTEAITLWIIGILGILQIIIRHFTNTAVAPAAQLLKRFSMSKSQVEKKVEDLSLEAFQESGNPAIVQKLTR